MPHKYRPERIREVLSRYVQAKVKLEDERARAYVRSSLDGESHYFAHNEARHLTTEESTEYERARVDVVVMMYEINGTIDLKAGDHAS